MGGLPNIPPSPSHFFLSSLLDNMVPTRKRNRRRKNRVTARHRRRHQGGAKNGPGKAPRAAHLVENRYITDDEEDEEEEDNGDIDFDNLSSGRDLGSLGNPNLDSFEHGDDGLGYDDSDDSFANIDFGVGDGQNPDDFAHMFGEDPNSLDPAFPRDPPSLLYSSYENGNGNGHDDHPGPFPMTENVYKYRSGRSKRMNLYKTRRRRVYKQRIKHSICRIPKNDYQNQQQHKRKCNKKKKCFFTSFVRDGQSHDYCRKRVNGQWG